MKTKIKIYLTFLLILISIINVNGAEWHNGTIEVEEAGTSDYTHNAVASNNYFDDDYHIMELHYGDPLDAGIPYLLRYEYVQLHITEPYVDIPISVGAPFILYDGTTEKGTGSLYIRKHTDDSGGWISATIDIYFEDDFVRDTDVIYSMHVYTHTIKQYFDEFRNYRVYGTHGPISYTTLKMGVSPEMSTTYSHSFSSQSTTTKVYYTKYSSFKNAYAIYNGSAVTNTYLDKDFPTFSTSSKLVIRSSTGALVYESPYSDSDYELNEITDSTHKYYIEPEVSGTEYLVYTGTSDVTYTDASLTFNDTQYDIGETMEFEYTDLDDLYPTNYTYDLQFYYFVTPETINYVYNVPLNPPMEYYTGTGYVNTHSWTPNKLYYGIIRDDLNYKSSKQTFLANVQLNGYVNLTHPYEFVNDTCSGDYCSYQNGDTITIVYNTYTSQNINILDGDDNTVQTLGPFNGFGTTEYTIPFDDSKQHSYPGWSMSMNTYHDEFMVYWIEESQYEEYYTDDVYQDQETVEENINILKDSIEPIKQLVIGFGGAIIENPDYDDNGIVGADELDQWFNGIIGLLIIVVIYIFYKGLKDR